MDVLQSLQRQFNIPQNYIDGIKPYVNQASQQIESTSRKISDVVEKHFTIIFLAFATIISLAFALKITMLGAAAAFTVNQFVREINTYDDNKIFTTMNATALGVSAMAGLLSVSYGGFIFNAVPLIGGIGLGNTLHRASKALF